MIDRITVDKIISLETNEIFVFGSNLAGRHGKGAARDALKFGAVWGNGIGLNGKSYAIPTKDENLNVLPLEKIKFYVDEFIDFVEKHPELIFHVTKIGCGLSGYQYSDIAPLFVLALKFKNIRLPIEFWNALIDIDIDF